jgi:hypothetical protein
MLTPYQFASNTPIQAIDLDGLEAYKKTTTDPNTGKTLIEITIDVKVKRTSNNINDLQAISYAGEIVAQLGATYDGDVDANTTVVVKANIINLDSDENGELVLKEFKTDGAFYIDFVDEVEGTDEPNVVGRANEIGNPLVNRFQVRVAMLSDPKKLRSSADIVRTGKHEIGHGLGLRHPWDPKNDVADVDQQGMDAAYVPSKGVEESTIINNILNSFSNPNENLRPKSNSGSIQSTVGQRKKIGDVVPEKK